MEDNILNKYWDSIKSENYDSSVKDVESWVRKESFKGKKKSSYLKSDFIKTLVENKVKYTVIFASLLIVFFTGKIPVNQVKPIGKVVSWTVEKNSPDAISKIDDLMWLDKSKLVVSDSVINDKEVLVYKMLLPPNVDKSQIASINTDLKDIKDISGFNLVSLNEPVKRPVYAAALYSLFNVDLSAIPAEHEKIMNDVSEQLERAGIQSIVDLDLENNPGFVYVVPKMDSDTFRVKIHNDIVRNTNIEKSIENIKKSLHEHNIAVNADSIIKNIVINFDNNILKTISCDEDLVFVNPIIDSIVVNYNVDGRSGRARSHSMKDSIKNKTKKNVIISIQIPDEAKLRESIKHNMDLSELKNMKIEVMNEKEMEKYEELQEKYREKAEEMREKYQEQAEKMREKYQDQDEEMREKYQEQADEEMDKELDNLEFNLNETLENIPEYNVMPDSVKQNIKDLKVKIKQQKQLQKQQHKKQPIPDN